MIIIGTSVCLQNKTSLCLLHVAYNSVYMCYVISLYRTNTGGATSKVINIRAGPLPPMESASGRFLWRVDGFVGEPVHSSEHPSSALTYTGAH